ncbi:arylesterase [Chitiniphilus eburneus]|uniref:Arylesterase n=1 Tax=Chitiniphilus eburneus TaxID=2571148 RepID=A0A4U0Q053_9NEIS|nr:arylesterase [Chitiniphilus eburneus]TJZ74265.1 arylesterase [Chitiniphilus eburneus]
MRRLPAWLPCLLILLCVACSRPTLPRLAPDATVLAFGDSLTYGTGANERQAYPAVLAGLIGRTVINEGAPGETSAQGRERLAEVLDETRPALVILCLGGNDFLQRLPPGETAANLRAMLEELRRRKIAVLLVGVPQPGLRLTTAPLYAELADEFKLPLEDEALGDILSQRTLKSDTVHPNADGYRVLAEAIRDSLERHGAL